MGRRCAKRPKRGSRRLSVATFVTARVQLTIPEVSRALNAKSGDFDSVDAVERAIRELVGAGLLHCQGGSPAFGSGVELSSLGEK